ncbi:hypothetical protein [Thermoanaerobacter thermocopriae]|uniref:hypothetical protein n=1 Tax=Thermoanaerobacter thermocopriae TaxID=29350 RepID=UPI00048BD68A|nr:hypothetical protein [Thermoanaerobacter thermocopriae]
MESKSYWEDKSLLNKVKKAWEEKQKWDEDKAYNYLKVKLEELARKYYENGNYGAITWIEKHNLILNQKHDEAMEKVNQAFREKSISKLYEGVAELYSVFAEIEEAYKKAKEMAKKYEVDIYTIYWDEEIKAYKIVSKTYRVGV